MTIENAESFFALDVLSWLFLAILLAIAIVLIDLLFFTKLQTEDDVKATEKRSIFRKICYFLIFLKFSKSEKYKHRPKVVQWSIELFPVLLLVLVFRGFIFEPFRVPSNSMMPTLLTGDFILVNKFDYGLRLPILNSKIIDFSKPERGDVIVFRYPNYEHISDYSGVDFIKRVIALPGDTISYEKDQLIVNDESVEYRKIGSYQGIDSGKAMTGYRHIREKINEADHDILLHPLGNSRKLSKITVPEGHYFVMGDNRAHSSDSRFWGYVPESYILGKAIAIWMHWDWNHNTMQLSRIGSFD
jgi:signal peptidase I